MSPRLIALVALAFTVVAAAQETIPIRGDRLSGFVLPVEPLDGSIEIAALNAQSWTVDDTKRLLLKNDVRVRIGGYAFASKTAVVWINRIPSADGVINQIAVYFPEVWEPTAEAGRGVSGRRVLVTGSTRGEVRLDAGAVQRGRPARGDVLRRAEDRLELHLRQLLAAPPELTTYPVVDIPQPRSEFVPEPGGDVTPEDLELPETVDLPPRDTDAPPLFHRDGRLNVNAGHIDVESGDDEHVITVTGGLVIDYLGTNGSDDWNELMLTARRAVIFTDPIDLDDLDALQLEVEHVRGVYLEGDVVAVADGGSYIVRSPKVFYDFVTGRAIMVDAILRTVELPTKNAVYLRADAMRQTAANAWTANGARVSTSEFHEPHLALGADRVTITQQREGGDDDRPGELVTHVVSEGNTVRVVDTPVFWWPRFSGDVERFPLRRISAGARSSQGVSVETTWDLFSLLGRDHPKGVDALLQLDGFTERGVGGGVRVDYDRDLGRGIFDLYGLADSGVDRTSAGRDVEPEHSFRGHALWEHQVSLGDGWTGQAQAAYISDPTFISSWRQDDFRQRREYETSVYLKHQDENAALTFLVKDSLNDFITNDWLLASRQYSVTKAPELAYRRYGDAWFDDQFTYSGETSISRVQFAFEEHTPDELGIRARGFPIGPDDRFSDRFRSMGYPSRFVNRFDSRHEFAAPAQWGIFDVVPAFVARLTAWDDDFADFSPEITEKRRVFAAGSLRISTRFQHVDPDAENTLLDIHRLRHLVEPSLHVWYGYSDVDQSAYPVYDDSVESLADGAAVRLGLRNTLQTYRGGPGERQSVDVLTLDTAFVFDSSEADRESPVPRFFDHRPEYSQFGDHFHGSALWLASSSLSVAGEVIYDIEYDDVALASIGADLAHTPQFATYIEYRHIGPFMDDLLDVGLRYRLTKKYAISVRPTYDLNREEFRAAMIRLTRSFPDFDFIIQIRYDDIREETTFGASLGRVEF